MKKMNPPLASAFVALPLTLLLASPALAQEVQTQTAPPPAPVVQTESAPVPEAVAPAPAPVFAAPSPVVQQLPSADDASAPAAPSADAGSTAAAAVRRAAPRVAAPARAASARSVSTPAPAPVAATPATPPPAATRPVAPAAAAPAPTIPDTTQADTQASRTTTVATVRTVIWPWIVGAIVLLGAILAAVMLRRRSRARESAYDNAALTTDEALVAPVAADPLYVEPAQVAAPIGAVAMAEPTPAEHTEIHDADRADVDALTAGTPTAADRPWIEFAMRPVRAGANVDEAMVEIELTIGNAGAVAADDVRIATFLFPSEPADADAFERMLLEQAEERGSDLVSIPAGEGTRLDATLAVSRDRVAELFNPVVVADARYRLPDGGEGRTLASFAIGRTGADGDFGPIANERAMHEDVEARLYAMPEHV